MPPSPAGHQRIPGLARTLIAFFAGAFLSVLFPPAAFATAPALAPTNVTAYDASTYACDSALHSVAVHTSEVAVVVPLGVSRGAQGTAAMLTEPFSLPSRLSVAANSARGGVYALEDESGNVVRTGRTNDLASRARDHRADPTLGQFQFKTVYETDVYAEQRGLEQVLYDRNPGAMSVNGGYNYLRPISPSNPNLPGYTQAANDFLDKIGRAG